MAIIQYPVDRTTLKPGDPVGVLYYQRTSGGIWTVGVHNGAYVRYDTTKHAYVVRHSGHVGPDPYIPVRENLFFYRTLQDLQNDTTVPNNRKYVLIKTYYTKAYLSGTSKPAIAWVLTDFTVHNGRFEKFVFDANYAPAPGRTYLNYNRLRQDFPGIEPLRHGRLYYSHYDIVGAGAGRRAAGENASPLSTRVLNIRRLYP